jgi:hypothetical protein
LFPKETNFPSPPTLVTFSNVRVEAFQRPQRSAAEASSLVSCFRIAMRWFNHS